MARDSEVRIPVHDEHEEPVDEECDRLDNWEKHCIYKLPACVADLNKRAYKPRAISFGPYHNGNHKLRSMECHKSRVLKVFLKRAGRCMKGCINEMRGVAKDLMDAYDSLDPKWKKNTEKFLEMMITDGCFMLELMAYYMTITSEDKKYLIFKQRYDEMKNPMFNEHAKTHMMPYIMRDMLLLENQVPKSLLIHLLSLGGHLKLNEDEDEKYIIDLIVNFCAPFSYPDLNHQVLKHCKHALHVHRQLLIHHDPPELRWWPRWCKKLEGCYYKSSPEKSLKSYLEHDEIGRRNYDTNIIPSATRLHDASIKIRRSDTPSIKNINFYAGPVGGILEIPHIVVDDTTEPVFLNLMAFERMHPGVGCDVTSYVTFMDDIIDNVQDVKILQKSRILSNAYGSDKNVAELFNSITRDATVDGENDGVFLVRYKVRKHCRGICNKLLGDLKQNYLNTRWSYFVVLAAFLAFVIATTGTVYTALEYYNNPSPPPKST